MCPIAFWGAVRQGIPRPFLPATAAALVLTVFNLVGTSPAMAHCFAGSRFFPAMLTTDDPCVADELSLPTISGFKDKIDRLTADSDPLRHLTDPRAVLTQ